MKPIDRFTRDQVSRTVWGIATAIAIAAVALAVFGSRLAVQHERQHAEERAVAAVKIVLAPALDPSIDAPLEGQALRDATTTAERGILNDPRVSRVRIWGMGGRLLFTTDSNDPIAAGSAGSLNDTYLNRARSGGAPLTVSDFSDNGQGAEASRTLLRTYTLFMPRSSAVAEVDQYDEAVFGNVRSFWLTVELALGGSAAAFALLLLMSLRRPVARIGAGVPFIPESLPPGRSMIEDERLAHVDEVYEHSRERVTRLEELLRVSDNARRRVEGELQRVLSRSGLVAAPETPPSFLPSATMEPAIAAEGAAESRPPPEALPPGPKRARPPAEKARRPASPQERPAAETKTSAATETSEPAVDEVVVIPEPETTADVPAEGVVRVPQSELVEPPPSPEVTSIDAWSVGPKRGDVSQMPPPDESAVEVLERLMRSEVPLAGSAGVDPFDMRARLARTAARKKPGGGEHNTIPTPAEPAPSSRRAPGPTEQPSSPSEEGDEDEAS